MYVKNLHQALVEFEANEDTQELHSDDNFDETLEEYDELGEEYEDFLDEVEEDYFPASEEDGE